MKTKLILLLLVTNFVYCQVTDVLTNLNATGVSNLTYKDNYIYFNSYVNKKVYRFDYTLPNSPVELVYQFNENPNFVYVKGNNLFVGVENTFKTYKINLLEQTLQPILIANIAGPMVQINNNLYIGQYAASKISKIDLNSNTQCDVLTGYQPNFFTIYNNELFFTSNVTNMLYKLNPNTDSVTIVLNNLNYASGIIVNENFLFICESRENTLSFYSQPSFQIDNSIALPTNSWPNGMIQINEDLYFVQTISGKISKLALNSLLSNTNFNSSKTTKTTIYPNPSSDFILISGKRIFDKYEIYDINGKLVQKAKLDNNKIGITSLAKGVFTLMLDNYSQTFIKE